PGVWGTRGGRQVLARLGDAFLDRGLPLVPAARGPHRHSGGGTAQCSHRGWGGLDPIAELIAEGGSLQPWPGGEGGRSHGHDQSQCHRAAQPRAELAQQKAPCHRSTSGLWVSVAWRCTKRAYHSPTTARVATMATSNTTPPVQATESGSGSTSGACGAVARTRSVVTNRDTSAPTTTPVRTASNCRPSSSARRLCRCCTGPAPSALRARTSSRRSADCARATATSAGSARSNAPAAAIQYTARAGWAMAVTVSWPATLTWPA